MHSLPDKLNPTHFAKLLGVTTEEISNMQYRGQLPPLASMASRKLRWYKASVQFWLDNDKPDREEFRRLWREKINS